MLALDVLSFRALVEGSNRLAASQKVEQAWTMMVAAQGQSKNMKEWVKPWMKQLEKGGFDTGGSASDFLAKYGGGI